MTIELSDEAEPSDEASSRPVDPVAGKTVAEILGEIVWLMTQDPAGREMKVADIEKLVMPAILQRRFHIRYARIQDPRQRDQAVLQPVNVDILAAPSGNSEDIPYLARFSHTASEGTKGD